MEATAEEKASGAMDGIRKHNEKMKLTTALETMAQSGKMVISGEEG